MNKVLLAGATGYLGSYLLQTLMDKEIPTKALVRKVQKISAAAKQHKLVEIQQAQLTQPSTLVGCCEGIDTVISTVGITKQQDGLTYMDVDYQANLNLLEEAKKQGVRKFIYVSVLNGQKLKHIAICKAKEKFVEALKKSGLAYCIIRPNGFFSDMTEFYSMAKNGRIYLFGNGQLKSNPIHGADLAKVCVEQIKQTAAEVNIGGPAVLTQTEIAQAAFEAIGQKPKITYIPDWVRRLVLWGGKFFLSKQRYGPIEFFMHIMSNGHRNGRPKIWQTPFD